MTLPAKANRFRVALSFPGEKREFVRLVAESLTATLGQERVLYDEYLTAELARPDLDLYLGNLYRNESDLVVPFYCSEYATKQWCRLEWRQMRDILLNVEGHRIMPFRFDDAPIDGVLSLDGYVKIGSRTPAEVARLILQRLHLRNPLPIVGKQHRVFISKLPTVNTLLVGRDDQIAYLDQAWANPATNFVQIIAPGGTGKTALMDKWFRRHLGEATVFGWSFYSQGTSTKNATSSDAFFAEIISWLKIKVPATASVYAKAEAVAQRLREERVLLILDGIEPLQDSTGALKDSALKALLQELDTANQGLILCTTRVRLDIPDDPPRAVSIDLENLTPEYGAEYLRQLKVEGEEQELQQASQDCGNHALALTLLGTYLADFLNADIRRRVEIRELMVDESKYGAHARRMMAAYERMFTGKPEAGVLRSLGFFDHPAEPEALRLVLPPLKDLEYRAALMRLFDARLVLSKDPATPVDCHPLIREHFAAVMRSTAEEAFRQGHSQLYEHYCKAAPEKPDTLDEMTPLFYAVYHGCQAGRHLEAFNSIYWGRIRHGDRGYLVFELGAFGAELSLLINFFETPWTHPATALPPGNRERLLPDAGFTLRALGRLADALAPIRSGAEGFASQQQWENAAVAYGNLADLLLSLGDVQQAIAAARHSVDLADRSGESFHRMSKRTTLAHALLESGDLVEAQRLFAEAEQIQSEQEREFLILYSLPGFCYCDLLLERGQSAEVIRRAAQTLNWVNRPLSIGLDHLSLGRAHPAGSPESTHHLNQAVDFLRQSGSLHHIPRGLLARGTPRDLAEVFRIASRSGMRLHLSDYHLASARLALGNRDLVKAREHFEKAETLVHETGYHRRDGELERLRVELGAEPRASDNPAPEARK
ncbi:MAG TPA: TIR domain-containing protein [Candidatus Angelobacter sp.]|nr:TIR domain-containing protein [Candidatus Angelobacter sp.]